MNKTWSKLLDLYFDTLIEHDFIDDDQINHELGRLIEGRIYQEIGKREAESFIDMLIYTRSDDFKARTEKFKIMYINNQKDYYKTLI